MGTAIEPVMVQAAEYDQFVAALTERVVAARLAAARAVNRDLVLLYWDIGQSIAEKLTVQHWGESIVTRHARSRQTISSDNRVFATKCLANASVLPRIC